MNKEDRVAVCSRSFSKNPILRSELLERYQNVTFNDDGLSLSGDSLVDFLRGHDKAITALEVIDEGVLSRLPELQVIGKYGAGLDMIDLFAMRRLGKKLGWAGGVNKRSVSELVISLSVSMLRHVPLANQEVRSGVWRQHMGNQLSGRVVGIIGCGCIGKDLVTLLEPWGCRILAYDVRGYADFYAKFGVEPVSLEDLLSRADVVTLHVPLDDTTRNILSGEKLMLMKPSAVLINAARGGLVDESVVKTMLKENRLAAAAFDVFSYEPPTDTELLDLPNFFATPHIGGSAEEAVLAMGRSAIRGLDKNFVP